MLLIKDERKEATMMIYSQVFRDLTKNFLRHNVMIFRSVYSTFLLKII